MYRKSLVFTALLGLTLIGCQKEEITPDSISSPNANRIVQHDYIYGENTYHVTLEMDDKNQVVDQKGDLKELNEIFSRLGKEESETSFLIEEVDEENLIYTMRIFETNSGLDKYCEVTSPTDQDRSCDTYSNPGGANFRFYRHTNYVDEFTGISRWGCSYFQTQWLDDANNQISSLQFTGSFVDLYGGSCFSGIRYRTYHDISNLHNVLVGYGFFTVIYGGDWCSSIKGYQ